MISSPSTRKLGGPTSDRSGRILILYRKWVLRRLRMGSFLRTLRRTVSIVILGRRRRSRWIRRRRTNWIWRLTRSGKSNTQRKMRQI